VRRPGWQVSVIQLLAVPGLLLSFYLWLYHEDLLIAACGASGWDDCGAVSGPGAPYASVGPIPVAALGFAGYAAIFLVAWLRDWSDIVAAYLPELLVGLTGIAVLFTAYLTALELFVIHAVCRYCLVSAAIVLVMLILAISYLRGAGDEEQAAGASEMAVL
jgi:uncharacterized membrane protein